MKSSFFVLCRGIYKVLLRFGAGSGKLKPYFLYIIFYIYFNVFNCHKLPQIKKRTREKEKKFRTVPRFWGSKDKKSLWASIVPAWIVASTKGACFDTYDHEEEKANE